jgi:hypothetical protein
VPGRVALAVGQPRGLLRAQIRVLASGRR